jgi:hypothetical protein
LSQSEWRDVQGAVQAASDCGCDTLGERSTISIRLVTAVTGRRKPQALVPEHLRPLREFLCESERLRRPAMQFAPALAAQGFTSAQIDAISLICS